MNNRAMLVVALTAGVIAAILVQRQVAGAQRAAGPNVQVLVSTTALEPGALVEDPSVFEVRSQPARYSPADALAVPDEALGRRLATRLAAGAYVTESMFAEADGGGLRLRRGERALTVDARIAPNEAEATAGMRVDLIASGIGGSTESEMLVTGAELLAISEAGDGKNMLTLRLSAGQTLRVARADVFARELRAVIVP